MKLGIDVIDLSDVAKRKRNDRSLKLILNSADNVPKHSLLFWLLWSAKEAVFKANRVDTDFKPKSIPIEIYRGTEHTIAFSSNHIHGRFIMEEDLLIAICSDNLEKVDYTILRSAVRITSKDVRASIRHFLSGVSKDVSLGVDNLGLPVVLPSHEPLSISHENYFGAFAFPNWLNEK